jgi:excisionase family DNA binding protein
MEDRVLITVSEAARRLETYPNAINRWIAKGELEAFRVEGRASASLMQSKLKH